MHIMTIFGKYTRRTYILLMCVFFISCTTDPPMIPKPMAYPRIEKAVSESLVEYSSTRFSFRHTQNAKIDQLDTPEPEQVWLNILYPDYNATIHCSYIPIRSGNLREIAEDNHRLLYSHAMQANFMEEHALERHQQSVYASVFVLDGNIATPIQFFLTDSISGFFRGSLYYDNKVNFDSVAPLTEYLKEDIFTLIKSFRWKK